jgi:hypothetical protein
MNLRKGLHQDFAPDHVSTAYHLQIFGSRLWTWDYEIAQNENRSSWMDWAKLERLLEQGLKVQAPAFHVLMGCDGVSWREWEVKQSHSSGVMWQVRG